MAEANQRHTPSRVPQGGVDSVGNAKYVLKLYVVGASPRSLLAISNIRRICNRYLDGNHELEIVDISLRPSLAKQEQIFASPTLVRESPTPMRSFVGDMSQSERILRALGVTQAVGGLTPERAPEARPP